MKKNFLLGFIAFAAMAVTSCTNDELNEFIPQEQAIEFGTYVGRDAQSRATATDLAALKLSGFNVFAYLHAPDVAPTYTTTPFMYNQAITWGTSWDYNPKKYWPTDDNELDFLAYGPSGVGTARLTTDDEPGLSIEINTDAANQKDIVVAAPVINQTKTDGTVEFTFSHILSRIDFQVVATGTTVEVNSVTIKGKFVPNGVVDLITGDIDGTPSDTDLTYSLTNPSVTPYMMIIPVQLTNADVTINYTMTYDGDGAPVVEGTCTGKISKTFVKGKAYTVKATISDAIAFSVVDNFGWENAAEPNVNVTNP